MESPEFQRRALDKRAKARSPLAPLFRAASRFGRIRTVAIRLICRLEGGQMWSATFRELMRAHYGVEIGMHSYGPGLRPGDIPPGTRIGNYCSVAGGLVVFRRNHPTDRVSQHPFFFSAAEGLLDHDTIPLVQDNPLTIGHDVWIGEKTVIAPRCRSIGDSAVVASGAVVTSDVPAFAVVGGVPARLMRWRVPEELRAAWVQSGWWLKPVSELAEFLDAFVGPFSLDHPPQPHCLSAVKDPGLNRGMTG